jgi:hypothetical protein
MIGGSHGADGNGADPEKRGRGVETHGGFPFDFCHNLCRKSTLVSKISRNDLIYLVGGDGLEPPTLSV